MNDLKELNSLITKTLIEVKKAELETLEKLLGDGAEAAEEKKAPAGRKTKTADKKEEKKAPVGTKVHYEDMKSADLYKLCCERGISSQCKQRGKEYLIKILKANDKEKTQAAEEEDWGEESPAENPYEGMKAFDLYKECKKRGINLKPLQGVSVYAEALIADDNKRSGDEESDFDEEDWNID